MKKYLILVLVACVVFFLGSKVIGAVSKETMITKIQETSKQFQSDNGQKTCTIGGVSTSLGSVLYAFAIQEGGWKDGTVGERTNNWGSLHKNQGKKEPTGFIHADNTKTRPIYATPEDGLYEKAELLTRGYGKCNLTEKSVKCYIKGCDAKLNDDDKKYIKAQYNNLKKNAKEYENLYSDSVVYPVQVAVASPSVQPKFVSDSVTEDSTRKCWKVKTIKKSDYIQADFGNDTRTLDVSDMKGDYIWLYSCYKK